MKLCFMFLGNRRFSYIVDKRFLIDEGYLPLLDLLHHYHELRSEILCSGYTTRKLQEDEPLVEDEIRRGTEEGRIGISTNGFEHVFLPTMSLASQEKLIEKGGWL